MKTAYIGLGSNLGERLLNLKKSLELIFEEPGLYFKSCSNVYETEPVGGPYQGPFLNACMSVKTSLAPTLLLQKMLAVEEKMKRGRKEKWGPRIIDLDLLIYEGINMNTPVLQLPHPRLTERVFVLIPLADIAPDLFLPGKGNTVQSILANRKGKTAVTFYCSHNWCTFDT